MMTFDDLCRDFAARRPQGKPVDEALWFSSYWGNPKDSINDLLRKFLNNFQISYINDVSGEVWFLYDDQWCNTRNEVDDLVVKFYVQKYR